MNNNTTYIKSSAQLHLEELIKKIRVLGLTIAQMESISKYVKEGLNESLYCDFNLDHATAEHIINLFEDFMQSITDCIYCICNENAIHQRINRLATTYGARFDAVSHQYDTFFEVISESFVGLNSILTKGPHKGCMRIDFILENPEMTYCRIRSFISNNILCDTARAHNIESKYIESLYTLTDDGIELLKADAPKLNSNIMFSSFEDTLLSSYSSGSCYEIISAILERFCIKGRKPIAAYLYIKGVLLPNYEPLKECNKLSTQNFSSLFQDALSALEEEYNIDLHCYKSINVDASKWIASFRSVDKSAQRSRLDRLLAQTRTDVRKLNPIVALTEEHVSKSGNYFSL